MAADKPNILWICTDSQRSDTIGALGNPYVSTPNIDKLVKSGAAFTTAYSQSPVCTPSRASFLTGVYPSTVHVNGNGNTFFPDTFPLVTRTLADAGYDCGLVGKLHLASAYGRVESRVDDGYRYWQYSHAPRDDWQSGHDYADWVRVKGQDLSVLQQSADGVPTEYHQTTWCAEKSIEFIREERTGPWLLSVNLYDPHPPFNPPKEYRDQFDPKNVADPVYREGDLAFQRELEDIAFNSKASNLENLDIASPVVPKSPQRGEFYEVDPVAEGRDYWTLTAAYYAMIKLIDDQFARVMAALEDTGQLDNTIVIFVSDHGEALGDHGLIQKGCRFYDGLIRVPLILSCPALIKPGIISDALVELMDLPATLLDLAGLPIPDHYMGKSLVPILTGQNNPGYHKDYIRCEFYNAMDLPIASYGTMYRDERYKIVCYHGHEIGELYDLQEDPGEFNNLWDDPDLMPLKMTLLKRSFDASILSLDKGPPRMGPM